MKKFLLFSCIFFIEFSTMGTQTLQPFSHESTNLVFELKPQHIVEEQYDKTELECLSKNIYFEAAVESTAGKLAVAQVTLNRVHSDKYPNTICEVVKQGKIDSNGNYIRHKCAFSWMCDGKPDKPWDGKMWKESQRIAKLVYTDTTIPDITDGSTHYHADYVYPYWSKSYKRTVSIDRHIFYR